MTAPLPSKRERLLRERQLRQNQVVTYIVCVMAGLVVLSLLILTGILKIPFLNSFSAKQKFAEAGDMPCPAATAPVAAGTVKVQVLNTTSRSGIARDATDMLSNVGFQVADPGNSAPEYAGTVDIQAGASSVDAAYTVARFFPNARVTLTASTEPTVTVLLGANYDGALTPEDRQRVQENTDPLQVPSSCVPLAK